MRTKEHPDLTFSLLNGDTFTVDQVSVFQTLSDGVITFEESNSEYLDNREFTCSRY